MLQVLIFVSGLALFALSFMVVLNSPEQSSVLYPGSNIRFLATMPMALLLVAVCPWLITLPPDLDVMKAGQLLAVLVAFVIYSAWVDSSFRGGLAKKAMKAMVTDKAGKNISFQRAFIRNFFKLILFPLAPISLYLLLKDFRRQSLHDKLAGTFVMWAPEAIQNKKPEQGIQVEIK